MAQVTLRGNPFDTSGELPALGSTAPGFSLVGSDLSEITADSLSGKKVGVAVIEVPHTPQSAASVRAFNERAGGRDDTVVLCVSEDLPFAAGRFCGAEGIENVTTGSAFRGNFAEEYGVKLENGPLAGLTARAVVVLDESGTVRHTQLVGEIGEEPDYDAALDALG